VARCTWFALVPLSGNLLKLSSVKSGHRGHQLPFSASRSFFGVLDRFDPNEQIIVLTSVLPHSSTEGYTTAMEKLTHVNGERVINMKHLSQILNNAVNHYTTSKQHLKGSRPSARQKLVPHQAPMRQFHHPGSLKSLPKDLMHIPNPSLSILKPTLVKS
jgi:hypothetical protein